MRSVKQLLSRKTRRSASQERKTTKLSLERFEDRLNMSGFGPEDGAMIIEPWTGLYDEVRIDSSGKILAAGQESNLGTTIAVVRYDSQGAMDTGYGVGGKATPALGVNTEASRGLVLQPDGKAVVSYAGGNGVSLGQHGVARLNTNGTLDKSFNKSGWSTINIRPDDAAGRYGSVGLQSNGKIVMAGDSWALSPGNDINWGIAARFRTDGAFDTGKSGFGAVANGNQAVGYTKLVGEDNSIGFADSLVQPDDKVVVVGTTKNSTTDGRFTVARYTANGALDTSFAGSGIGYYLPAGAVSAEAWGVVRQTADGKIVVAGSCRYSDGTSDLLVTRLTADGAIDTSFGAGTGFVTWDINGATTATYEVAYDVGLQPDGKIVVTGYQYGSPAKHLIVGRFNTDGAPDGTFGNGGFKTVASPSDESVIGKSLALQPDGSIIVAGVRHNESYSPMIARFYGDAGPMMSASSAAAADQVFSSPDAGALSSYLGGWMNEPTETATPWGKRKR